MDYLATISLQYPSLVNTKRVFLTAAGEGRGEFFAPVHIFRAEETRATFLKACKYLGESWDFGVESTFPFAMQVRASENPTRCYVRNLAHTIQNLAQEDWEWQSRWKLLLNFGERWVPKSPRQLWKCRMDYSRTRQVNPGFLHPNPVH